MDLLPELLIIAALILLNGVFVAAEISLVTAFGHGPHTCPAQPFSLAAMSRSLTGLIDTFELRAPQRPPEPLAEQIGGVARGQHPCLITYRRRPATPTRG